MLVVIVVGDVKMLVSEKAASFLGVLQGFFITKPLYVTGVQNVSQLLTNEGNVTNRKLTVKLTSYKQSF